MRALGASRTSLVPGGVLAGPWVRNDLWRRARAVPSLDLRFADNKSLTDAVTGASLVTFTRASNGTFVGSAGVIQTAATDVPRFDHNPTTGESLGLLVEEARTNICLSSEDFSQNQAVNNVAILTNQITAPDGTITGDLVTSTLAGTVNTCWLQQLAGVTASTATYTMSCFVKQGTSPSVSFNIAMAGGTYVEAFANFNFSTKAIGLGGGGAASATAGYQQLSNGWFRLWLSLPNNNTGTQVAHRVYTRSEGTANVVGDSVYFWGRVLEAGAFPTSYIPTTTAAATRNADLASITGSAFSSWYRQDEGTVFVEYSNQATAGQDRRIFNTSDATAFTTNGSTLFLSNGTQAAATFNTFAGGLNIGPMHSSTPLVVGVARKAAYSIQVNSRVLVVGGAAPLISSNSYTPPSNIVTATLGQDGAGASSINGTIRRLTYWGQRLPNNILQGITQ